MNEGSDKQRRIAGWSAFCGILGAFLTNLVTDLVHIPAIFTGVLILGLIAVAAATVRMEMDRAHAKAPAPAPDLQQPGEDVAPARRPTVPSQGAHVRQSSVKQAIAESSPVEWARSAIASITWRRVRWGRLALVTGVAFAVPVTIYQCANRDAGSGQVEATATGSAVGGSVVASEPAGKSLPTEPARQGVLKGHTNAVKSLAMNDQASVLVSGGADRRVRLWSLSTHQMITDPMRGHTDSIIAVAINSAGSVAASASADGTARLWDARIGKQLGKALTAHKGDVNEVAFSPDGSTLVTGGVDGYVRFWNVETGEQKDFLKVSGKPYAIAFSPDGEVLAVAGCPGSVELWHTAGHRPFKLFNENNGVDASACVSSLSFSADGTRIIGVVYDEFAGGQVELWPVRDAREVSASTEIDSAAIGEEHAVLTPDGRCVVIVERERASVWKLAGGTQETRWYELRAPGKSFIAAASSLDRTTLVRSDVDFVIHVDKIDPSC